MVELRLLGAVDLSGVEAASAQALLVQSKSVAALAYLALATPRAFHRRDRLAALLWPELDQEHARAQLRRVVHALRHTLGEGALMVRGDEEVGLAPGAVWCDAVDVDESVEAGRYARALELYRRGELLPGFFLPKAAEFEDWLDRERTVLRDKAAAAAWGLAARSAEGGDGTIAAQHARHAVRLAPSDERMLRRVMALLERLGDTAGALHVYDDFARRLRRDFAAEPSGETRAVVERLRAR
jgi:serine/threonine-protein kinase